MEKYEKSEESYKTIINQYIEFKDGEKESLPISVDFKELTNNSKDAIGWIYSEGTNINYPIVQGKDNEHYLSHLPSGAWDICENIFVDFKNSSDFSDMNTIIYGHNMKNGSMLSTLEEYKNQEYYDEHPIIYLLTPEKNYKILLISGYTALPNDEDTYTITNEDAARASLIEKALEKINLEVRYYTEQK